MSRNPYVDDVSEPILRSSVVAFCDILGYRDMLSEAQECGKLKELLHQLHNALLGSHRFVDPNLRENILEDIRGKHLSAFRAFTDNIVVGRPISEDGESELGQAFYELSHFQMSMTIEGFFIRGCISVGDLYMDDITVFGQGLIDAYNGETTLADKTPGLF